MADHVVDAKGLNCPLPILRAKKGLREVPVGGILQLLATDPGSVKDMEAFCRQTGHELVESADADGVYTYLVKRTS
ncbi:MAG: sulfurtransferase TusA family protein [Alphaproteobacteria bacterium]|mgnify:CR=1 FL=1|jgi:tRNA 2-thiouridine synthesizing protein A|nr:sulfurtransferase TusA family protein [Alphaproteobacteria bacterium]MDP6816078.1 sulfurtransferase TusA family protein [Alphaproteobacteria bacterium]